MLRRAVRGHRRLRVVLCGGAAQKNAGVMKQMKQEERERLEQEAALGRRYLAGLRREVARLGGLAECGLEAPVLEHIAGKIGRAGAAGPQAGL